MLQRSFAILFLCLSAAPGKAEPVAVQITRAGGTTTATSPNFQICTSASQVDLESLARSCEQRRTELLRDWLTVDASAAGTDWTPRCTITIHQNKGGYQRALGAGAGASVGCTTIRVQGRAICERRIDVRADADAWHVDALPHELTHVVLADRFGNRPLPLWADEGIGVLSESVAKQQKRDEAALRAEGRTQPVTPANLLYDARATAKIPPDAFYARSADLVALLIARRDRPTFLSFLEEQQARGSEAALRKTYGIEGVAQLQKMWNERSAVASGPAAVAGR